MSRIQKFFIVYFIALACGLTIISIHAIAFSFTDHQLTTFVIGTKDFNNKPIPGIQVTVAPPQTPHGQKSNLPTLTGVTGPDGTVTLDWKAPFDNSGTFTTLIDPKSVYSRATAYGIGMPSSVVQWVPMESPLIADPSIPINTQDNILVKLTRGEADKLLGSLKTGVAVDNKVANQISLAILRALSRE